MEAVVHHVKSFVNVSCQAWPNNDLVWIDRFENVESNVSKTVNERICQVLIFEISFVNMWIENPDYFPVFCFGEILQSLGEITFRKYFSDTV